MIFGTTTGGTAIFRRQSPGDATPRSRVGYTALWQNKEAQGRGGGGEAKAINFLLSFGFQLLTSFVFRMVSPKI